MLKLKCGNREKTIKFRNIIGRCEIIDFLADNGYAMMDYEMESILGMQNGEILRFYFPNKIKHIDVEAI